MSNPIVISGHLEFCDLMNQGHPDSGSVTIIEVAEPTNFRQGWKMEDMEIGGYPEHTEEWIMERYRERARIFAAHVGSKEVELYTLKYGNRIFAAMRPI